MGQNETMLLKRLLKSVKKTESEIKEMNKKIDIVIKSKIR
jgi:hypothetical protein